MTEIFSVFDEAARRYVDPFVCPTIEFAIRSFRQACETEGHQFGKFPEDYSLWHVGSFDPEYGMLEPMKPSRVAQASSFVDRNQTQLDPDVANGLKVHDLREADVVHKEGRA